MSKLHDLITQLCPDGVPYRKLDEVAEIKRGRRLTRKQLSDTELPGTFPVFHGGLQPIGYYSEKNRQANTVMITNVGAAGTVLFSERDFWSSDGCFCLLELKALNPRFAYYYLKEHEHKLKQRVRVAGIPTLDADVLKRFEIPLPPLPVQSEIVRILDAFTELEAELEAELTGRIEQYEYYRDYLLDEKNLEHMDGGKVEHDTVDSLVDVITATAKIKKNEYKEIGLFPVIDQGMNTVIAGYTDNANALPDNEWILFGDHTCSLKYFDGRFVQGADGLKILKAHDNVLPKFVFYALKNLNVSSNEYARHWTSFKKNELPVPSIATQERIVDILDRFDTLTTSLTDGIPAEIAMRREQYEYYRSRLLDFPRLPEDSNNDGE